VQKIVGQSAEFAGNSRNFRFSLMLQSKNFRVLNSSSFKSFVTFLTGLAYEKQRHKCRKLKQPNNMKTKLNLTMNFLTIAVAIVSLGVLAADAREFNRSGSYQNSRGYAGTFAQTIDRQPGQYSRVTTLGDGKTATVNQTVTRDGSTSTVDGSHIGFDGKTSDWNNTITANGNGTASVNGQYTRQNGNTIDTSATVTKTSDGHTTAGNYSTSTGKTGTFDTTVVNSDGTRTKTETIVGANGQTVGRIIETTRDDNTIDSTATATGPNGKTETTSGSVTFNQ
jgi:hypothetical protein